MTGINTVELILRHVKAFLKNRRTEVDIWEHFAEDYLTSIPEKKKKNIYKLHINFWKFKYAFDMICGIKQLSFKSLYYENKQNIFSVERLLMRPRSNKRKK